uniref:Disintegrin and metalloproteinase domain-containing protein 2 n=1 Tax=Prolemur simus TaxID=1328070 RepID=A0A8C8YWW6_PROSS
MLRVLLLLAGLGGLSWLWTGQNSERLLVEITVPVKTHSVVREEIEVEVSYKIVIEGKTFILNLMQKTFLPYNFRVYGYNGTEIMKPLKEEFQNFCYYQGYIEDYPNSMVIISTCNGIRGLLQFENISYGIEPLESSVGFEHVIYRVNVKNPDTALYTVKDIESRDLSYKIQSIEHPRAISMESLAVIFTQLLSLSMGITYDDTNKCHCSGAVCIMNPEAIHFSGVKMFSNCSMEDFAHFISKQKSQCLQNQPRLDPSYKEAAVCGNEQVETGEECDCGTLENCANVQVQCCDGSTCQYVANSDCADGPCCNDCQYKGKDQICRSAIDECDLPEYCNGSSSECQEDLFVQNGHPCGDNQWFCFDGLCSSGSKQCKDLFTEAAGFGTEECFRELNTKTDQSGNCGSGPQGYTKCATNDVRCVALEYPHDHAESANMWVRDGTTCGTNKVCKNRCVSIAVLGYDCTAEKCSNHGKCNNRKNCHCDSSFLPPTCATEDAAWPGGSIDSGNFPPAAATVRGRYIESAYHPKPTRWPFFLLIPFFIILCVLIAMLAKVRYQRKKWKTEDYTSDEQLESEALESEDEAKR